MKLLLSLAICFVGYIQHSAAECEAGGWTCNSKTFSLANGATDSYGSQEGPCFSNAAVNGGDPTCYFTHNGLHYYRGRCTNCGSGCDCPEGGAVATTCQSAYGQECVSQTEKNSNHWQMNGEGSCFLTGGSEKCYIDNNSGSYTGCNCNSHSSCKCGTTVVVTCAALDDTATCSGDSTGYCAASYDKIVNGVTVKHTRCTSCMVQPDICQKSCQTEVDGGLKRKLDGLSEDQKIEIVDKHNELRSKVARGLETLGAPGIQHKATDMNKLVWDTELAAIAQDWVNNCTSGHDVNRNIAAGAVGQNFAGDGNVKDDVEFAYTNWYAEVKDMNKDWVDDFSVLTNAEFHAVGHYTQMVWAKTERIGCGFIVFDNGINNISSKKKYVVCNYFPSGNYNNAGTKVYTKTTGTPGSGCAALGRVQNTATGLCD